MAIEVTCTCGKRYRLADKLAGRKMRCKTCNAAIFIPGDTTAGLSDADSAVFGDWQADSSEANQLSANWSSGLSPDFTGVTAAESDGGSTPRVNSTELIRCPFPGSVIESLMESYGKSDAFETPLCTPATSQFLGRLYLVLYLLLVSTALVVAGKVDDLTVSMAVFGVAGLLFVAAFMVALHFGAHHTLTLGRDVLRRPLHQIGSVQQGRIVAVLLYLTFGSWVGVTLLDAYDAFRRADLRVEFGIERGTLATDLVEDFGLLAFLSIAVLAIVKPFLAPSVVGVKIKSDATPGEVTCGFSAILVRAPLYAQRLTYPVSVVAAVMGAMLMLISVLFDTSEWSAWLAQMSAFLLGGALVGLMLPVVSYVNAIYGLAVVELLMSLLSIRSKDPAAAADPE